VVRGVAGADVAADRAAVSHLDVGDHPRHIGDDGPSRVHLGRVDEVGVRRHRPELEPALGGDADLPQLVERVEIDQHVGRGRARLHDVQERLPAGEGARVGVAGEETDRVLDRGGTRIFHRSQQHGASYIAAPIAAANCDVR
jgi:hypothetical protein